MRAALIREPGGAPEVVERDEPRPARGDDVLEVAAAALNPLDVAVAGGRFYGGSPDFPYVPGCEAVGRLGDGRRAYVFRGGLGVRRDGTLAERALVGEAIAIPLPDDVPDGVALACGIAGLAGWLPLSWRAPVRDGDRVLVLGATGTVGLVAVQAARVLGAERVVAAGRNAERLARAREVGADATVDLAQPDLEEAFRSAFGGDGPTLVVDALWGAPASAAVEAAATGARVVQVGQSAGREATLTSNAVRGKQLEIYGFSTFVVPPEVVREHYLELAGHAAAGRIRIDLESYDLDSIAEAWRRQTEGPRAKLAVLI